MNDKIAMEWTAAEIAATRQLLHEAVRARGMEVAEFAVVLNKKFEAALAEHQRAQQQAANGGGARPGDEARTAD